MTTRIQLSSLPIHFRALTLPSTPRQAVGIDLGTTNSVVSLGTWDPAEPEVLQIRCIEVEQPTSDLGDQHGAQLPTPRQGCLEARTAVVLAAGDVGELGDQGPALRLHKGPD